MNDYPIQAARCDSGSLHQEQAAEQPQCHPGRGLLHDDHLILTIVSKQSIYLKQFYLNNQVDLNNFNVTLREIYYTLISMIMLMLTAMQLQWCSLW